MNIAGVLVHARADALETVRRSLDELAGVEVHAVTHDGRLIVTVEDHDGGSAADTLLAIHRSAGVLSAALVYHVNESDADTTAEQEKIDAAVPA